MNFLFKFFKDFHTKNLKIYFELQVSRGLHALNLHASLLIPSYCICISSNQIYAAFMEKSTLPLQLQQP